MHDDENANAIVLNASAKPYTCHLSAMAAAAAKIYTCNKLTTTYYYSAKQANKAIKRNIPTYLIFAHNVDNSESINFLQVQSQTETQMQT